MKSTIFFYHIHIFSLVPFFYAGIESRFWKWGGLYYWPLIKSGGAQPYIYYCPDKIMGGGPTGPLRWLHPCYVCHEPIQPILKSLKLEEALQPILDMMVSWNTSAIGSFYTQKRAILENITAHLITKSSK